MIESEGGRKETVGRTRMLCLLFANALHPDWAKSQQLSEFTFRKFSQHEPIELSFSKFRSVIWKEACSC